MKRIVTFTAALLSVITLSACGAKSATSDKTSSSSSSTSNTKLTTKNGHTAKMQDAIDKYNQVKVGSEYNKGKGGTSVEKVKAIYGNPDSTTHAKVEGTKEKSTVYNWKKVGNSKNGLTMSVEFYRGKTIFKSYSDYNEAQKISNTKYKTIKKGASYKSTLQKLGTPVAESVVNSGISGVIVTKYYNTSGKEILLTFANHSLLFKGMSR
ncbi:hypothetical protein FC56_GL000756 [Lentilactobacillus senioris DSM 24302 = JCM 17472]|uniref:DUF3862 domain-containing protein n=1 Tax=Lentilactobacillus senioris DSM 24302 = JCM 17472 TaxID=1423802 RepID=A0A0R2CTX8_9LACO|nr:DUF3862 domain-containing protein [Lentilactobacillus senioris]KRM93092.1 hypothetical protein FC56_GL000756 [Lentilactobacillus senioris DSM 24302 = JCM 17472]